MAKARIGARPARIPEWPWYDAIGATPPTFAATTLIDGAGEQLHMGGWWAWSDGATHDLDTIYFRVQTAGSENYTLRLSLRDVDLAAGPVARCDSTVDQSWTSTTITANSNQTAALDAPRTVAHGSLLGMVFDFSAYTAGTFAATVLSNASAGRQSHYPFITHFDGTSTYASVIGSPAITGEADDGTFGYFLGGIPAPSAALGALAFNSGSAADEAGIEFTVPENRWAGAMGLWVLPVASASFDLVLYEGTTPVATKSFDYHTVLPAVSRLAEANFADVALTSGQTYRLMLKPTTANNVTIYWIDVTAAGYLDPFFDNAGYTTRVDGGSFAAPTLTRLPMGFYGLIGFEDGAGGSGGNANILTGSVVK